MKTADIPSGRPRAVLLLILKYLLSLVGIGWDSLNFSSLHERRTSRIPPRSTGRGAHSEAVHINLRGGLKHPWDKTPSFIKRKQEMNSLGLERSSDMELLDTKHCQDEPPFWIRDQTRRIAGLLQSDQQRNKGKGFVGRTTSRCLQ